jgi:DNA helicase-2/ATP-dependent DNA helicase PcrA
MNESDEAQYVAAQILGISPGPPLEGPRSALPDERPVQPDRAGLQAQRRALPHHRGTRFFDRAEVKDMLAYLCAVNNPADDLRLVRILNNPPGDRPPPSSGPRPSRRRSTARCGRSSGTPGLPRAPEGRRPAGSVCRSDERSAPPGGGAAPADFYEEVVSRTGYAVMLEAKTRWRTGPGWKNVRELLTSINSYIEDAEGSPPWRASWTPLPCILIWTTTTPARTAW